MTQFYNYEIIKTEQNQMKIKVTISETNEIVESITESKSPKHLEIMCNLVDFPMEELEYGLRGSELATALSEIGQYMSDYATFSIESIKQIKKKK